MSTTPRTITQRIHSEEYSWNSFRRALRKEDQALFDLLWVYCRRHAHAVDASRRQNIPETLMMTMLLGVLREMQNNLRSAAALEQYPFGSSMVADRPTE